MNLPESSVGSASALTWNTYRVRRHEKQALLDFVLKGLVDRGCRIVATPDAGLAPFYIVFETPSGERQAVLAYLFHASPEPIRGRDPDERRFQVKYGGELRGVLEVAVDGSAAITTIFLGIDLKHGVFVAADPIMNAPSPMSRSIEYKVSDLEDIRRTNWHAWERSRHAPKTRTRPTPELDEDTRIQVLVGGTRDRIYDLIVLERLALGLDPGERHLLADELSKRPKQSGLSKSHRLLDELELPPDALFDLIDGARRLKMAVRGWVAEQHLQQTLSGIPGVTECVRLEGEGQPDIRLRWKGSAPVLMECKNVLRTPDAQGRARLDFQRTRASKGDPCSRYYEPTDFALLAACLHAVREKWVFAYAITGELPDHPSCRGRISNNLRVVEPLFDSNVGAVLDKCTK